MTKDVENRVIAFVRSVAGDCAGCMRRAEANCRTCRAKFAQALMRDISVSTGKVDPIDYSLATRMHRIVSAIESANRPLTTSEIDLGGTCSFQLKYWTLRYMVRKGVLVRTVAFRRGQSRKKYYRYFLRKKKQGDNKK